MDYLHYVTEYLVDIELVLKFKGVDIVSRTSFMVRSSRHCGDQACTLSFGVLVITLFVKHGVVSCML